MSAFPEDEKEPTIGIESIKKDLEKWKKDKPAAKRNTPSEEQPKVSNFSSIGNDIINDRDMSKLREILNKSPEKRSAEDLYFMGDKFRELNLFETLKLNRTEEMTM